MPCKFHDYIDYKSLGIKKLTYPIIMYRSEIGSKPRYPPDRDKEMGHICSCEIILLNLNWFIEDQTVNDWHGPLESIPTDSEINTWKRVGTHGAFQGVILTGVHFDKSRLFLRLQAKRTQNPCACDII